MREKCRAAGMDLDHEAGGMDAEISFTAMLLTLPSETWKNRDRRVLDVGFGKMKINKPENGVCLTLPSEIWKRKTYERAASKSCLQKLGSWKNRNRLVLDSNMNTERKTRRDRRVFFCDGIQQDVFLFCKRN